MHLSWNRADTLEALQRLRAEFITNGYLKAPQSRKQKQEAGEGPFRRYTSTNGFQIYVGKNSQSNDLLLRQIAKPNDMWLHTKQIHGSHVIIRNPENRPDIPMPTLLQAAQLAAYYSKAHHASNVPVDYTWAPLRRKAQRQRRRLRALHTRKDIIRRTRCPLLEKIKIGLTHFLLKSP